MGKAVADQIRDVADELYAALGNIEWRHDAQIEADDILELTIRVSLPVMNTSRQ